MTEDREKIGEELSKVRKLNGFTLEELARRVGVTKSYLSKIENGHKAVPAPLLRKFADVYKNSSTFSKLIGGHKVHLEFNKGERNIMGNDEKNRVQDLQINLDPIKTPVLYSDFQKVDSNDGGVVISFGQSVQSTPVQHIISRLGLSHAQARGLYQTLGENLKKYYKNKDMEF